MYVVSGKIPSLLWNGRRNRDEKNLEHNSKFQQMIRKLLVLLLCLTAATATAKKPKSSASKKAESSAEKPKESDYDKLFKEKHTVADGMFRLHDVKGKLYFEIPDSLFGREMLLGSTISEVSDNAAATTGSKSDYPLHVVFTRNDRSVQLRTVNCENITDETGASRALAEAVKRNTADPILRNYKIEAWNRDSTAVVVNVTDLFVADVEEMSPFSKYGLYTAFELKKTFQKERSMLGEIKAFSDNVVVRSTLSYIFTLTRGRTTLVKDQPLTAVMTRSLVLLPREPYRPRITDSRMSVFPTGKVLFSEREQRAKVIYYAHRWRLEPSDMDAWKRGERVAPKKQIVFYVDDGFPEMWKKHIFEAVDQWNEPFGRIGFKNAIAAKPYPKDDPEFDPDNIKYSCIRYAPIAIANAMGPSWVDPATGEILAACSYPTYDQTDLENAKTEDMNLRLVTDAYEPGSVFKTLVAGAGFDLGAVRSSTSFEVPASIKVGDDTVTDADKRDYTMTMDVREMMRRSSNVGFVLVGRKIGADDFATYVDKWGIGHSSGVDFPGESLGIVKEHDQYDGATLGSMSFGQALSVSPIEVARAVGGIANGGVMMTPHFYKSSKGDEKDWGEGERAISEDAAAQVTSCMQTVVSEGTGVGGAVDGYDVAGKTGTAEIASSYGGYEENAYVMSFGGWLYGSSSDLVCLVTVNRPLTNLGAGGLCGPVFSEIMSYAAKRYQIDAQGK